MGLVLSLVVLLSLSCVLPYGNEKRAKILGCISIDKKKVIAENKTPEIKAVAIPLKVPVNNKGKPKVNSTSQRTCVRHINLSVNILHSMMRYDRAQIKLRKSISISYISLFLMLIIFGA